MTVNLLNYDLAGLMDYFQELDENKFRAKQILQWIHQRGVTDFQMMTDLSLKLRQYLSDHAQIVLPKIIAEQISQDGTRKWLCELENRSIANESFCVIPVGNGNPTAWTQMLMHQPLHPCARFPASCGNDKQRELTEMVFIPEVGRGTLCVSSQVGCPLGCAFCATGKLGFTRNLTTSEIIGQVWLATRILTNNEFPKQRAISNVVLMGMGEPLLNLANVVKALNLMMDDLAYGLSKRRVTVSTAGIVPAMWQLRELSEASLAVSLHAPNNELRNILVPINRTYPLEELLEVCRIYFKDPQRRVTFEYVMLNEINDSKDHAKQLVKLLQNIRCKINLIPCNFSTDNAFKCSSLERIEAFRNILLQAGFNTITRKTRGKDIAAACGQLIGEQSYTKFEA